MPVERLEPWQPVTVVDRAEGRACPAWATHRHRGRLHLRIRTGIGMTRLAWRDEEECLPRDPDEPILVV